MTDDRWEREGSGNLAATAHRIEAGVGRLEASVEQLEIRTRERRQSRSDDDHER